MSTIEQNNIPLGQTAFRQAEKIYKARGAKLPDLLTSVIDFYDIASLLHAEDAAVRQVWLTHDLVTPVGLPFCAFKERRSPAAYVLKSHPDLIVIPDMLTTEAQRWLARKCLCDCTRPPNRTNLDPFFNLPAESLFTIASEQLNSSNNGDGTSDSLQPHSSLIQSRAQLGCIDPSVTVPKEKLYTQPASAANLLDRLRWCTLGMQYNWTTKEYDLGTSTFDAEIDSLMRSIAVAITQPDNNGDNRPITNNYNGRDFVSQAGIVNFYDEWSTMAGHVDKTEEIMNAPLISLSIGLSCIYLIGGKTRDTEPTALLLRSGDVLAMCGESRLAFHGVPRVLPESSPKHLINPTAGDSDVAAANYPKWHHFAHYLATHRINCNARKCT
ncbi:hypothetical protein GGI25_005422 [Coemansia spiralis]|uniref:Alpha-ketoglutarate-dependent dioxygenase AlkB-like domain-containing protein n=2 Tax=Coemansia TaxID=4863 RepID=A0A9W8KVQ8_9FUNG|nr:hypothetical protein EDC05_005389 [Coemansia umbellata]KAJ2619610.1 hypothetical protein GGI26_005717 [Coemansia sp. RSA 1358]KAJ2671605.1 hypothetical protein GGI25_005422 [Coemansia spiralis]